MQDSLGRSLVRCTPTCKGPRAVALLAVIHESRQAGQQLLPLQALFLLLSLQLLQPVGCVNQTKQDCVNQTKKALG